MKPLLGSAYTGCYRNDVDEAALWIPCFALPSAIIGALAALF